MKILVISLAGIGDTLLATPMLRALREQLPHAQIDVLVMWAGSRDLLHGNPHVNTVHQCNLLKQSHFRNFLELIKLRRNQYDLSFNAFPQGKVHYRLIARLIGATRRASQSYENHSWFDHLLVTHLMDQDYTVHCIENNLNLLRLVGLKPRAGLDAEIFFTPGEIEWAAEFARNHRLAEKTVLGVHVGSGKTKNLMLKRWPVEHYIAALRKLLATHPRLLILLFGGPEEAVDNQRILKELPSDRILQVPSRTIRQAAAALSHCQVFLSVDNAFMHLAATVKVPRQVVIESPTFNKTIEPYGRPYRLVPNPMVAGRNLEYYRYDGRDIQGGREHLLSCMRSIQPGVVVEAVERELESIWARYRP